MYCLYVGVDYTYIDVNALAQGIKFFLASHVWFHAVARARTYAPIRPQLLISHANHSATETCMYVSMYVYVCIFICIIFIGKQTEFTQINLFICLLIFCLYPL